MKKMEYNDWSVRLMDFVCQNLFVWILNLLYTLRRLCFQLTSSAPPSMVRSRVKLHASRIFCSSVLYYVFLLIFLSFFMWGMATSALKFTSKHAPNPWSGKHDWQDGEIKSATVETGIPEGDTEDSSVSVFQQKSQQLTVFPPLFFW